MNTVGIPYFITMRSLECGLRMNTVGITYFITMRSLEWTKNEHGGYYILHNNEELGVD